MQEEDEQYKKNKYVRQILWDNIRKRFSKLEQQEFRRIVGEQLVQKIETARQQFTQLYQIFQDLQSQEIPSAQSQQHIQEILHEKLIQKQIGFLIENLKKRAEENGLQAEHFLRLETKTQKSIYKKIHEPSSTSTRPSTATTSNRPNSTSQQNYQRTLRFIPKKLDVFDLDIQTGLKEIVRNVRLFLHREYKILIRNISELRDLISKEKQWIIQQHEESSTMPTLPQMKEYSKKLEKQYISLGTLSIQPSNSRATSKLSALKPRGSTIKLEQIPKITSICSKQAFKAPIRGTSANKKKRMSVKLKKSDIILSNEFAQKPVVTRTIYTDTSLINNNNNSPRKIKTANNLYGLQVDFLNQIGLGQIANEINKKQQQPLLAVKGQLNCGEVIRTDKKMSTKFREIIASFRDLY